MNLNITVLDKQHLTAARQIALAAYRRERRYVPDLPEVGQTPDLAVFAENGLGVAALDEGTLVGFLGFHNPGYPVFGLAKGTFSPEYANGATGKKRGEVYDRMYQAAAQKLAERGIASHGVIVYYHDEAAKEALFLDGFGGRTMDLIRPACPVAGAVDGEEWAFGEAGPDDLEAVAALSNLKDEHLSSAPMFMPKESEATAESLRRWLEEEPSRHFFVAKDKWEAKGGGVAAYLRLQPRGESFVSARPEVLNITGACNLPQYRGSGVSAALLNYAMDCLRERKFTLCGVDCETFNYTARRFWGRYFTPYTIGVVRRIDERCIPREYGQ